MPTSMDPEVGRQKWLKLRDAVLQIYNHDASTLSFEELHRQGYDLVLHKFGEMLYEGIKDTVRKHLAGKAEELAAKPDDALLQALRTVYESHCIEMRRVRDVFIYMDRTWVQQTNSLLIYDMGTQAFRETVLRAPGLASRIRRLVLETIRQIRAVRAPAAAAAAAGEGGGAATSSSSVTPPLNAAEVGELLHLLRAHISMLVDLGITSLEVYTTDFEEPFLSVTAAFYTAEAAAVGAAESCVDYLRYAEARLLEEQRRAQAVLHVSTEARLMASLERLLISDHVLRLIEMDGTGLGALIDAGRHDDLARMFRLFSIPKTQLTYRQRQTPAYLAWLLEDARARSRGGGDSSSGGAAASSAAGGPPASVYREATGPPLQVFREAVKVCVVDRAAAIVGSPDARKDSVGFVKTLILLRDRLFRLVETAFRADVGMMHGIKTAFEAVLSGDVARTHLTVPLYSPVRPVLSGGGAAAAGGADAASGGSAGAPARGPPRPSVLDMEGSKKGCNLVAEYLSLYVDQLLQSGTRQMSEDAVHDTLAKVVSLFRMMDNDRDVFLLFYRRHLQRRLLSGRSASEDLENVMISKLKAECGLTETRRFEVMLHDRKASQELMGEYRRHLEAAPAPAAATDIEVSVLTSGSWEDEKPLAGLVIPLPTEVKLAADHFKAFYLDKFRGRRLTWWPTKGTGVVRGLFDGGRRHDLVVSTIQMVILTLFNTKETLTYKEVLEAVGGIAPEEEVRRHVLSLLLRQYNVLKRAGANPGASTIPDSDVLSVNGAFTSSLIKIVVPLLMKPSAVRGGDGGPEDEEAKAVAAELAQQRATATDAAIVRVMKARKTVDHTTLVADVLHQLGSRFQPAMRDIKARIETLITKEYIERDPDSAIMYHYVA